MIVSYRIGENWRHQKVIGKNVPKSLSLIKEKKNTRAREEEKERTKLQKQSRISLVVREKSTRRETKEREFVYLFKVRVKSKGFPPLTN